MLLTDDELMNLLPDAVRLPIGWSYTVRAIEAAVLAKLREQEPVGEVVSNHRAGMYDEFPIGTLLYTHPAPIPGSRPNATDHNPHFVGHVDDLFDEEVIKHAEFSRTDLVFIAARGGE